VTLPGIEMFFGKYLGFSPTDESSIGMGEMEMVIGQEKIAIRMATGLKIHVESMDISEFEVVSPEDVLKEFLEKDSECPVKLENIVGELKHKRGAPVLIFLRELEDTIDGIMMTGTMADMLGPTYLLSQSQVDKGVFDEFVAKLEDNYGKNQFPRISKDGKA
jgi:hypothetical protein